MNSAVEPIDSVFRALSDPTRRDVLERLSKALLRSASLRRRSTSPFRRSSNTWRRLCSPSGG